MNKLGPLSADPVELSTEELTKELKVRTDRAAKEYYERILSIQLTDMVNREKGIREQHRAHVRRLKKKFRRRIQILREEKGFWQKKALPSGWVRRIVLLFGDVEARKHA